jgi:tetratricopeptide (TPR) repeat protein/transcriptional regulator with XRE-family HTH domain
MGGESSGDRPHLNTSAGAGGGIETIADLGRALRSLQRRARDKTGRSVTCRKLADETGYAPSSISNWLSGRSLPSADRLGDILLSLGATRAEQRALATARDAIEERRQAPSASALRQARPPRQLPWANPKFTGRTTEVKVLSDLLSRPAPTEVVLIAGTAGVGKTALAVHLGHRIRDHFPDGCLYVDLRGFAPDSRQRMTADEAVTGFLHALGVSPADLPPSAQARAARYRSELDGRRLLVVADNAYDLVELLPLLPGSPGCAAIVTSRNQLDGLVAGGADVVCLELLSVSEARALLRRYLGTERVEQEPAAVDQLIGLSARLPLALTVIAARAAALPRLDLTDLAGELAHCVNAPESGEPYGTVREALTWSYTYVSEPARRMFRLFGLHHGPDLSEPATAGLAGIPVGEAVNALGELAQVGLLEKGPGGRYTFHDLLRQFAAERAMHEEDECDRWAAIGRLHSWFLHTADAADRLINPRRLHVPLGPRDAPPLALFFEAGNPAQSRVKAIEWFELERANLLAVIQQAMDSGQYSLAWKLPAAMWGFLYLRKPLADWVRSHDMGLAAARRDGDLYGEAWTLYSLGTAHWIAGQHDRAIEHYEQALIRWRRIDHQWGEAMTLNNLAAARSCGGQPAEALGDFRQALGIRRQIGDERGQVQTIINIAETHSRLGDFGMADRQLRDALAMCRRIGYQYGQAMTLHDLGVAANGLGRPAEALAHLDAAAGLRHTIGDRQGEAESLHVAGKIHGDLGNTNGARQSWHRALRIFTDIDDPQAETVRQCLRTLNTGNRR